MNLQRLMKMMRARVGNIAGSLVALALAVAMMYALAVLGYSGFMGPDRTYRYANADAVVRVDNAAYFHVAGDQVPDSFQVPVSKADAEALAKLSGVKSAVPDRTFPARLVDENGHAIHIPDHDIALGQSWDVASMAQFSLSEGRAPEKPGEIVVDRSVATAGNLHVGGSARVALTTGIAPFSVVGIAERQGDPGLPRESLVYFSPEQAATLSPANGAAESVAVTFAEGKRDDGLSALRGYAKDHALTVLTGDARGRADTSAANNELKNLGALFATMSGIVGFVAIFVLVNTFGFAIQQRQHEIAVQRAIGYTSPQIRREIAVEAGVIGIVGGIVGIPLGWGISLLMRALLRSSHRAPDEFALRPWIWAPVIAIGAALLISQLAAFGAARRAAKIPPVRALRESLTVQKWFSPVKVILGLGFVALSIGLLVISRSLDAAGAIGVALGTAVAATVGLALLAPTVVFGVTSLMRVGTSRAANACDRLAVNNSRARSARVGASVAAIVLSLGFATLVACFNETLATGARRAEDRDTHAQIFVMPDAASMPTSAVDAMRKIDGVQTVAPKIAFEAAQITTNQGASVSNAAIVAVDPAAMNDVVSVKFKAGGWSDLAPGKVLLSSEVKSINGVKLHDSYTVMFPDGTRGSYEVVGFFEPGGDAASAYMTFADATPHLSDPGLTQVLIRTTSDEVAPAVSEKVAALSPNGMPLQVVDKETYLAAVTQSIRQNAFYNNLVIGGAAAFGMVSVVNTVVMTTLDREREFRLMRFIGALKSQVLRTVTAESLLTGILGALLGTIVGVVAAIGVSLALVGDASALSVPVPTVVGYGAAAIAVVVLSTLVAAMGAVPSTLTGGLGTRE